MRSKEGAHLLSWGKRRIKKTASTSKGAGKTVLEGGKLSFSEDMEKKGTLLYKQSLLITDQEFQRTQRENLGD